jgi:two-component system OmpR family response regulator
VLRRQAAAITASATEGASALSFLGWRIDFRLRELRNPEGARVAMTSAEFDLLRTFCERPGRVLSRDSLLDLTQGRSAGSFERSTPCPPCDRTTSCAASPIWSRMP